MEKVKVISHDKWRSYYSGSHEGLHAPIFIFLPTITIENKLDKKVYPSYSMTLNIKCQGHKWRSYFGESYQGLYVR